MQFSQDTMQIGATITIPHSFVAKGAAGVIVSKTRVGINVEYGEGLTKQSGFYAYDWLQEKYGDADQTISDAQKDCPINDKIPF